VSDAAAPTSTPRPTSPRTALVLGGGGITGIAWEVGVLSRLLEAGIPLGDADLVVGTSAGSVVGTTLRRGSSGVADAYAEQLVPAGAAPEAALDGEDFMQRIGQAIQGATSAEEARARLGALARQVPVTGDEPELVTTMRERFGADGAWPEGQLAICTVDATDGEFRVLTAASGVPLHVAVAASCSVPLVWPTVEVDGRPTMDGGIRSGTNADVADAAERVLVLSCGPELSQSPLGPTLPGVVSTRLGADRPVFVIEADAESLAAFGANSLSSANRGPAAEAGRRQADSVVEAVRAFWAGA
jgi:NTE family protein